MSQQPEDLTHLNNIGPTIARRLTEIGIRSRDDLVCLGAAEAYRRLVALSGGKPLPVCYYLYSLRGALDGVHWNDVEEPVKRDLLTAIGRDAKRKASC